ncbi:11102_t:CDS:2 [Scutellospora calospora]|uniref:11102_t:CDS:1 n=1 Tax=Scutellospora calospora TaxID=85575 RepID=A0ACA9K6F9_9GLOM|nr:11102_t:CDS:2 [Scutellospora calospora]
MLGHDWQAAGPTDKRSACPGLNALANHGYLPRDGENITAQQLIKAVQDAYNVSAAVSTALTYNALVSCGLLFKKTFDLKEISKHNGVEHDASLTRKDHFFAKYRQIRLNHSKEFNPEVVYGIRQKILSAGEIALLLLVLGGNTDNEIDIGLLETFLKDERVPDGWRKPDKVVGVVELFNSNSEIMKKYDELEKMHAQKGK